MSHFLLRINVITLFIILTTGCAAIEQGVSKIPIGFSLFRSPVSFKTGLGKNGEMSVIEKCELNQLSEMKIFSDGNINPDEHENIFKKKIEDAQETCKNPLNSRLLLSRSEYDNLDDLYSKESNTYVFVAISGGGARAAVLAEAVFSLLERKYNNLSKRVKKGNINNSLLDNIDVFSTVSGGSLFSYRVARANALLNKKGKEVNRILKSKNNNINIDEINDAYDILATCNNAHGTDKEFKKLTGNYNETNFVSSTIDLLKDQDNNIRENIFECIKNSNTKLSKQGFYSALFYMSPLNLFIGPLITSFTDESYLSVLAGTLHGSTTFSQENKIFSRSDSIRRIYDPSLYKLSELPNTPRFFFNATAIETGLPFVFTQRFLQTPLKKPVVRNNSRLDDFSEQESPQFRWQRPLGAITTLEDLNSSPANTPLAFAAIASAAFPVGFEPLSLTKYGYDPVTPRIYESNERLHVSDGGLYDNSGLSTLSELFSTIRAIKNKLKNNSSSLNEPEPKPTLILLSINADADEYDSFYPNKIAKEASFLETFPVDFNWPIRGKALGFDSLSLIHYVNKRRAEQLAVEKINKLCGHNSIGSNNSPENNNLTENSNLTGNCPEFHFLYFPVNLSQLSSNDKHSISDPSNLYSRLKAIPTNFVISDENKLIIYQSAELIVTSEQNLLDLWKKIEPNNTCSELKKELSPNLKRLDEAFAFYVLCTSAAENLGNGAAAK